VTVERPVRTRVLIVEDDEVFRRPLQRALEAAGCEVVAVPSGEDALAVLGRSTVDLLLTDHRLPGMDGVQLITRSKAMNPALAVVVMTAHGTAESAVDARRHGADAYLVKPFAMPDLLVALHGAVEQRRSPARAASSERPWPE
jgi:DNA-binding NtrC family response regulator